MVAKIQKTRLDIMKPHYRPLSHSPVTHHREVTTSNQTRSPHPTACSFSLLWGGISHTSQMALFLLPHVSLLGSHRHRFYVAAALPREALDMI